MSNATLFQDSDCFKLLPAIFRDCVDHEGASTRFRLEHPQPVGEYVVATNGRIMVRMRHTPEILASLPEVPPGKFPSKSVNELADDRSRFHSDSTPIPSLDDFPRCGYCSGKGSMPKHKCHCDDFDFETPCHGRGIIPAGPCYDCDGTGIESAANQWVDLRADVRVSAWLLHILVKHGASIFLPVAVNTPGSISPCYFTVADDVDGVVMPGTLS